MTTIQLTDVEVALLRESITLSIEATEDRKDHPHYKGLEKQTENRIENLKSIYKKLE